MTCLVSEELLPLMRVKYLDCIILHLFVAVVSQTSKTYAISRIICARRVYSTTEAHTRVLNNSYYRSFKKATEP